jgi:glycosyltransferase involved in cell wall biosynthesis
MEAKVTYGLVMIVKDEEARINDCLASAFPHISTYTIVDTGSTDSTQGIIRATMSGTHTGKSGQLVDLPWVNFGHNRSEAFALARGTADWLLALDADMTVEIDADFEPDPKVDAYMIEMRDSGTSWRLPLLLRGDLPWESKGAVHECTTLPDRPYIGIPTDKVRVSFSPTQASPTKRHWHAAMLEEELAREPDNARTVFYLAQTYREMGDPRALELYQRRAGMGGFIEEVWYAQYRAALLHPWPGRAAVLMAAWEQRPSRLEPLYWLLRDLNSQGAHHAAYRLAQIPGDAPDDLFVERWVWEWGFAYERSIAAWWVGEREESLRLSKELLERDDLPTNIRAAVERNAGLAAA